MIRKSGIEFWPRDWNLRGRTGPSSFSYSATSNVFMVQKYKLKLVLKTQEVSEYEASRGRNPAHIPKYFLTPQLGVFKDEEIIKRAL
jgi:hypothetical protein